MNCIIVDDDTLSRNTLRNYVEETPFLKLVTCCSSAMEAANVLSKEKIDLVFLDVEMPKMSGLELIKTLEHLPRIILVTANTNYAIEAFEHEVTDYIVKPATYARFLKAVKKVQKNKESDKVPSKKANELFVKVNSALMKITMQDILWIEALGDYVTINTISKNYTVYSTLKGIEDKLPKDDFIRIHRSFIVRQDKITAIDDYLVMIDKKSIPVSKSYKEELMKRLNLL